jgi:hypothetical protein
MALHMTRADRVLSTPPTNTPTYTNRRRFLSVAAGSAVAAAIPAAAPAAAPAIDPIYAASDKHRQAVAAHDAATDVRAAFNDVNMNDERRTQLAVLEGAVDDAWDRLEDAGITLVNTDPITLAGIVALCRYVEPLLNESGTVNLPEVIYWDDDTHSSAGGALVNVIAVAVRSLSKGGDHVG